ncbi:MAG: hypothetical protein AAB706_03470 [Patescibacteria group bacterium]
MDKLIIEISEEQALNILDNISISYDEGIGKDTDFIIKIILDKWPDLRQKVGWLGHGFKC